MAASVAGLAALGYVIFQVVQARRPLSDRSSEIVMAMVRGDAATLMRYAPQTERIDEGLTQEKLQQVMDHLLTPYVKAGLPHGTLDFSNDSSGAHALSEYTGHGVGDHPTAIAGDVYRTPNGLEVGVLRLVLTNSWRLRFYRPDAPGSTRGGFFLTGIKGVAADRAFLEGLGLKGWVPVQPDMDIGLVTWDAVADRDRKLMAEYDADPADQPGPAK
ncbi:MAG: hypothetical protein ACYC96_02780 [Fimbriimonadaceae bacterium]